MSENKNEKFKRLAVTRVNKALKAIELIGNLGNKALYDSSPEERKKIIRAITDATNQMKFELEGDAKKKEGFKLE